MSSDVTHSGLRISSEEVGEFSSAYFGLIEITFENTSSRWLRVMSVSARFADAQSNQQILVPIGEDLQSWLRATLGDFDMRTGTWQGGASEVAYAWMTLHDAVGGGLCAASNGEVPVAASAPPAVSGETSAAPTTPPAASQAAAVPSASAAPSGATTPSVAPPPPPFIPLTLDGANALAGSDPLVSALPETHLMHVPFAVPPGLFARRFLVLDTSQSSDRPCLQQLLLDVQLEDGSRERALLNLRGHQVSPTRWKRSACKDG